MFETTQTTWTGNTPDMRELWEQVLLNLGAAQTYDEIAQAVVDGARTLCGGALVTLTLPTTDGHGTTVVASGGMTEAAPEMVGVDLLPILSYPLIAASTFPDGASPLLRIHGGIAADDPPTTELLARFAPHALLALERGRAYEHMKHLAYSDPLTGLANSRALQDALSRAATIANDRGTPLALLIIDLDDFRRYNTSWGHLVGDAALRAFARALRSATRNADFVARVGGEEFAVLLPDSGELEARVVAAHIHEAIATGSTGLPSPFTASIGVGLYPNDVPDAMSIFAVADTAVLMAKREGKNRTYVFETIHHVRDTRAERGFSG